MNTLLFKVWFSFYRFCIQSNLYVYSLKENHSVVYDLDVVKHYMLYLIYGTDWNLLCYVDFTERASGGVQNSEKSTCVGFSCVGDTNNRIESFIHMNFWHSNFARFPKNFYCKTFYGKNVIWNHKSANKNHEQFSYKFWLWSFFFIFLFKSFYIFFKIYFNIY